MTNLRLALSWPLVLWLTTSAAAFQFTPPEGWRDLSPSAPVANFEGMPDHVVDQATKGGFTAFAVDPVPGPDGAYATFGARVMPQASAISPAFMESFIASASAAITQRGLQYVVREQRVEGMGNVNVGRYVADLSHDEQGVRQLVYVYPGAKEIAVLVYSASPAKFDSYLPAFEAAARRTGGLSEPSRIAWLFGTDAGHYRLGQITGFGLGFALVSLVIWRVVRR